MYAVYDILKMAILYVEGTYFQRVSVGSCVRLSLQCSLDYFSNVQSAAAGAFLIVGTPPVHGQTVL